MKAKATRSRRFVRFALPLLLGAGMAAPAAAAAPANPNLNATARKMLGYLGAVYQKKTLSGIDVYGVDFRKDVEQYRAYHDVMAKVSPGKMLALGECDAIPDPDKTRSGRLPQWLYAMPWWGAPSHKRPADWAIFTMRHDFVVTLDEMPAMGPGPLAPQVGILEPRDDGAAWFADEPPVLKAYAVDRDGKIDRVNLLWGWKIHPSAFTVDVTRAEPDQGDN